MTISVGSRIKFKTGNLYIKVPWPGFSLCLCNLINLQLCPCRNGRVNTAISAWYSVGTKPHLLPRGVLHLVSHPWDAARLLRQWVTQKSQAASEMCPSSLSHRSISTMSSCVSDVHTQCGPEEYWAQWGGSPSS